MRTLTIRIDDRLEAELQSAALREGKSKSELARELLRKYLLLRELDVVREKLRPYAEAAGDVTDEDFFRDLS